MQKKCLNALLSGGLRQILWGWGKQEDWRPNNFKFSLELKEVSHGISMKALLTLVFSTVQE